MNLEQYFGLKGRVALVTGGGRGLGRAMAVGFADAGADVLLASRSEDELRAVAEEIRGRSPDVRVAYLPVDLSERAACDRLAAWAVEQFGKVDILVNNAGINQPQAIDAITDESWDRVIEVNLNACMALTRAIVPGMKRNRWGRVIYISSIMGFASKEGRNAYSTTKAALLGLARANALDLGEFGITVNCIAPGPFLTDMPGKMLSDSEKNVFASRTALARWGRPDELVGPVLMMASEAGSYVTGASLIVDGGTLCKTF